MKKRFLSVSIMLWTATAPLWANAASLDLNASGDAFRGTLAAYVGKKVVGDLGVLSTRYRNNRDSDTGLHAGLHFVPDAKIRLGTRLFYVSPGTADVMALGLGLQLRLFLSRQVSLGGHFYYGPESFSFMDSEGYSEFALRLSFRLARKAHLYLGYRTIKVKVFSVNNKVELDDDPHLGLKLYF